VPEGAARPGDRVEFFGPSVDLDDFAARSGTIGYHVLTSLGPRYRREYVRGEGSADGSGSAAKPFQAKPSSSK
jgi:hypothetical protein